MAISTLLKIDGVTVPNVKWYKVVWSKLWTNAGRTMAGDLKADFIGIFPSIEVNFISMGATDLKNVISMLNKSFFTLTWYDPKAQAVQSAQYYAGDFDTPLFMQDKELYKEFSVTLVPVKKYS
jgi:hypothetical protein